MTDVSVLRLFLLGAFRIERGALTIHLPTRKVESLLAYLVLYPEEHTREKLAALFWGDSPDADARASLRVALNNLRKRLDEEIALTERETIQLNPDLPLWVDAREYQRTSDLTLYRGELLADFYDDWVFPEREHFRQLYLAAMLQQTQLARTQSEYARAIEFAQRVLADDPANEQAHQHLMFCHIVLGNRRAALGQYEKCERTLQTDLGVKPAPETIALYEWIKQTPVEQRTLAARLTNLPIPLTSFIGRQKEIGKIKELLARTRLLTLTGAGGCGKTRLAIQIATELVASGTFKGGVWWVNLAPVMDGTLVAQGVAKALGVRETPHEPLTETLAAFLRERDALLVLDNCEHLVGACAQFADELLSAAANTKILTTSREALGLTGEMTWRVPSLSFPDADQHLPLDDLMQYEAIRLFVERAEAVNSDFAINARNAMTVAKVCQHLDGIPLAIELAAARMKVLSAQQIAARLDDRFNLLTVGSRTALPRQQTLRATVEWSYDLLSEEERALLIRLSVFVGGWTLEAAEQVTGPESFGTRHSTLDLLSRLVDKSLVVAEEREGEMRYRILETLRQYGAEKLRETGGVEPVRYRHALFFAGLAEQAERGLRGAEMRVWLERLEIEHGNFRAALEWSLEHEPPEFGLRFADALGVFWMRRGYISEGRAWLERLIERGAPAPAHLHARAMVRLGWLVFVEGDYPRAKHWDETSLALLRAADDKVGMVDALNQLGLMANYENDVRRSTACFAESLTLCDQTENRFGRALPLLYRTQALLFQNQWSPQVKAMCEQGLELFRELDDKANQNMAHIFLGLGAHFEGDDERAAKHLEESVALGYESRDKRRLCWALLISGLVLRWVNRIEEGLVRERESMLLARELGDKTALTSGFQFFAHLACARNEMERVARLMGAGAALGKSIGVQDAPMQKTVNAALEIARTTLGEKAYAAAFAEGGAMSLERAIGYALEEK